MSEKKGLVLASPKGYSLRKNLQAILKEIDGAITDFNELTGDKLETISTEYADTQEKLAALKAELAEKQRVAALDLELLIKANKRKAFESLGKELGLAIISEADLRSLRNNLATAEETLDEAVETAVKKANASNAIAKNAAVSKVESQAAVETAQLQAQNESLTDKVMWLEGQLSKLEGMLKASQDNAVKIAEAGSKSINVTTDSGRK